MILIFTLSFHTAHILSLISHCLWSIGLVVHSHLTSIHLQVVGALSFYIQCMCVCVCLLVVAVLVMMVMVWLTLNVYVCCIYDVVRVPHTHSSLSVWSSSKRDQTYAYTKKKKERKTLYCSKISTRAIATASKQLPPQTLKLRERKKEKKERKNHNRSGGRIFREQIATTEQTVYTKSLVNILKWCSIRTVLKSRRVFNASGLASLSLFFVSFGGWFVRLSYSVASRCRYSLAPVAPALSLLLSLSSLLVASNPSMSFSSAIIVLLPSLFLSLSLFHSLSHFSPVPIPRSLDFFFFFL